MKITFLGTSDGYPEEERFCSCSVVTVNGKHYVIDAGVSLCSTLVKNKFNPGDVGAVFITHMHADHSSGLVEFIHYMSWGGRYGIDAGVFVPTHVGKHALLSLTYAMDPGRDVDLTVYKEGKVFEDENVRVTAFRTMHNEASFGFLIEAEGKKVYFSGDMRSDISDMPDFVYNDKTDLIVCESAHNRLPLISDKLNAMKTGKIVINHISSKHSQDDFNECRPLINKPFILAYDGMTAEI